MASNEETPMDVDDGSKIPPPKESYFSADDDPKLLQARQSDDSASNNDVAELKVSLTWPGDNEMEPKKLKSIVTKTLQSWANKNSIKGDFTATKISEDGRRAVISASPADALKELLNLVKNSKELFSKEKTKFSITPISQEEQSQDDKYSSGVYSSLTQQKAQRGSVDVNDVKDSPTDNDTNKTCLVALGPYWYMKNFYPDKLRRIERENRVRITENVAVVITEENKGATNPKKASEDFTMLVQSCIDESRSTTIPLKKVNPEQLMETLKLLKTTDRKCQITISSDEITIFGPQEYRVAIEKSLQSTKTSTDTIHEGMGFNETYARRMSNFTDEARMKEFGRGDFRRDAHAFEPDRKSPARVKFTSNFTDPFVSDGLPIEDYYWERIVNLHVTELDRIQEKFNVHFRDTGIKHGNRIIKVRYKKAEKNMSMESHAIRALLRLYQKVALSYLRPTSVSLDNELDLYTAPGELNGATGKTSKDRGDNTKGLTKEGDNKKPKGAEAKKEEKEEEKCPVCIDKFKKKTTLNCKHEFCKECLEQSIKALGPTCPVCKDVFGLVEGNQPDGRMSWRKISSKLPGFEHCGTIEVNYNIPPAIQTAKHPNPGQRHSGAQRTAYLPDNKEGNEVLMLLKKAFDQRLIFTVGTSRTTGAENMVTWNDIHHKTSMYGGPESYGYPDKDYLSRVKDELKAKGIK